MLNSPWVRLSQHDYLAYFRESATKNFSKVIVYNIYCTGFQGNIRTDNSKELPRFTDSPNHKCAVFLPPVYNAC